MADDPPVPLDDYPVHQAPTAPADPDTLILHHGSLRAMVQGSYWG
ncbi:hypothetical protein [Streptomyces sp. NPDC047706]